MNKAVILVISDDPNLRENLAGTLKVNNYMPLTAKNEAEGLSLLQIHRVDLTIIDFGYPDVSGLDLLSKIRVDHQSSAAIILTGTATLPSAVEATSRGALLLPGETVRERTVDSPGQAGVRETAG
jgi:DNA-binding NtrC family response regulator